MGLSGKSENNLMDFVLILILKQLGGLEGSGKWFDFGLRLGGMGGEGWSVGWEGARDAGFPVYTIYIML